MTVHGDSIFTDIERQFLNWKLIDSYEDLNTGTAFDYDSGDVTVFNVYKVVGQLIDQSGAGNSVSVQLNGHTGADYHYDSEGDATVSSTTGVSSVELGSISGGRPAVFTAIINGGNYSSTPDLLRPHIAGNFGTAYAESELLHGGLDAADTTEVDRIRIFSEGNATGRLRFYGMNL